MPLPYNVGVRRILAAALTTGRLQKIRGMCFNVGDGYQQKMFLGENAMGIRFAGHRGGQPYRRGLLTPQRASRIFPLFPAPQGKEKTPI
jgi:hypothetical protein